MDPIRVRRVRDSHEALAVLEPLEPAATPTAGGVAEHGVGRLVKVWVAERRGQTTGFVGVTRYCRDRWAANAVCADDETAWALASIVDASPARRVAGLRVHIEPMIPRLARAKRVIVLPCGAVKPGQNVSHRFEIPPTRARLALITDLDGLVEFYSHYELEIAPTVRRVREVLVPLVQQRRVVIVEDDGRIVAAQRAELRSRQYQVVSGLAVEPAARGQSLSRDLAVVQSLGVEFLGLGTFGTRAPTNHGRWGADYREVASRETWLDVVLAPRRPPFRGYALASRALERAEGRVRRRSLRSTRS